MEGERVRLRLARSKERALAPTLGGWHFVPSSLMAAAVIPTCRFCALMPYVLSSFWEGKSLRAEMPPLARHDAINLVVQKASFSTAHDCGALQY